MKEKKKIFSKIWKSWKKRKFSFGTDGDLDWVTICFSSLFILIIIFAWSTHLFFQVSKKIEVSSDASEASYTLIDQKGLQDVLERYKKRHADFNILSE